MKTGNSIDYLKFPSNVKEKNHELHLFPYAHLFQYRQVGMGENTIKTSSGQPC